MASTIWKGHLTFGLVSIPIKLFRAARAEKIHMHHLERTTGARVRQVLVPNRDPLPADPPIAEPSDSGFARTNGPTLAAESSPDPLERSEAQLEYVAARPNPATSRQELVRGFEYEKDKYVEFERAELEEITPKASSEMQILEFVHFAEVDPVYLESSYYVAADFGGIRPYSLLFEALQKTGYAALAEFVMHRRDQTMILRAGKHGIIGHTLFYEDEVKGENEFHAEQGQVVGKEMELAVKLVAALAAPFDPAKFKDKYRERLHNAISQKLESGTARETATALPTKPVIDIMEALKQSLFSAKKPVARELGKAAEKSGASKTRVRRA